MCLVSYVPLDDGFVISSNRDEAPSRSTNSIQQEERKFNSIAYPVDSKGGTWCAVSKSGIVGIILNGAFVFHKRQNNYRLSRGIMLKEMFDFPTPVKFIQEYNFQNIEPFTLIIWTGKRLLEFRWTGQLKHIEILSRKKHHVWSSSTLYDDIMISERQTLFDKLISKLQYKSVESIEQMHLNGKLGNSDYDFVMNRSNRVRTVSFSQVVISEKAINLNYHSLLKGEKHHLQF